MPIRESISPIDSVHVGNAARPGDGEPVAVVDPSSGRQIGAFRAASRADVDHAVSVAAEAAENWAALPSVERGRRLFEVARRISSSVDDLADIVVRDAGLPRALARRDVEVAARYFEYYAGLSDKVHGETIPLSADVLDYTVREPWGVCAIVLPFNFPAQLTARDLAPALAMGNSVVLKPAEQAPLSALALVEICWECGLPPGTVNAVTGLGPVAGDALVRHPLVDHVTFTGSQATGRRVMAACADTLKPSTIELGGKSPHLLFADGSVDAAVASIVATSFKSAGQACSAGTRLLVQSALTDAAIDALQAAMGELTVGPAALDPDVGPLITGRQRDGVLAAIDDSVAGGARALNAGRRIENGDAGGFFVDPTILVDVEPSAPAAREEIFGPVVSVVEFASDDEGIAVANDTEYGLVAGIWTRDVGRAHRVARAVKAGQVFVNNYGVGGGVELPFGGYKRSGIGRVKGVAGALEYTQLKNVCVALT